MRIVDQQAVTAVAQLSTFKEERTIFQLVEKIQVDAGDAAVGEKDVALVIIHRTSGVRTRGIVVLHIDHRLPLEKTTINEHTAGPARTIGNDLL